MNAALRALLSTWVAVGLSGCSSGEADAPGEPDASSSAPAPRDNSGRLEEIIAFDDTQDCIPAAAFTKLLREIAPMDAIGRPVEPYAPRNTVLPGGYASPPRLTTEGSSYRVEIKLEDRWHGLDLTGLSYWWTQESDHQGFELHFGNSPRDVISILNSLGFNLNAEGSRTVDGELSTFLVVEPAGEGAKFVCSNG